MGPQLYGETRGGGARGGRDLGAREALLGERYEALIADDAEDRPPAPARDR